MNRYSVVLLQTTCFYNFITFLLQWLQIERARERGGGRDRNRDRWDFDRMGYFCRDNNTEQHWKITSQSPVLSSHSYCMEEIAEIFPQLKICFM
jgi:hypothetical protein